MDLALNNLQTLICYKNPSNQLTNHLCRSNYQFAPSCTVYAFFCDIDIWISIQPTDGILISTTIKRQIRHGSNGIEDILHAPHSYIHEASYAHVGKYHIQDTLI